MVVGLRNDKLSEKLQMNSGLTLEQAVQQARQSENVRKQQGVIRSHPSQVSVESLTASKSWRPRKKTTSNKFKQPSRDGPNNYMPRNKLVAAKAGDIIRSTTGRLVPPRMLDVTNALNKVTLRNVVALKAV